VQRPGPAELIQAIKAAGLRDERVLGAVRAVPRVDFVPSHLVARAYVDEPLPIPHGQVTTQPSLIARMVEALALDGSERVLEVGTGYGFQTALLSRLARFVWSIERWSDLAEVGRANLARLGVANVEVVVGDGTQGLPEHAPFDAILVSAAFPAVPSPLAAQVALGGRLVQPIGPGGSEEVMLFEKTQTGLVPRRMVTSACFVPLVGRHGYTESA
jgi:protein-L-isoaspartate(D-aspartate) O-methyltransferase